MFCMRCVTALDGMGVAPIGCPTAGAPAELVTSG